MRAEEQPAVVFIGFRTAGKTWLVHRFLKVLFDSGLDPNPGFKEIPHGQTVRLEASDKFDFYQVPPRPGTDETFWLIDTPGERTQSLMDLKVEDLWSFVVTLHYASAVVIALPIDVVLFGPLLVKSLRNATEVETLIREAYPEREPSDKEAAAIHEWIARLREDHDGIDRFVRGVHHAASTLSLVRFNDRSATIDWLNKEEYTRLITEQDVRTHRGRAREFEPVGGPTGQDKPTFVALTKADRMVAALFGDSDMPDDPTGELTAVKKRLRNSPQGRAMRVLAERHGMLDASDYPTAHPATFIRRCNANLHVRLIDWFPLSKFDFVSAFFGHDYTNELVNDHYDKHPGFGVEEMLGWVREARKLKGKGHRSPHNIARRAHLVIHDIQGGGGIS